MLCLSKNTFSGLDKITSADARVPFPQGKGTKGCRGPARIPCGAPAPGPPSDKYLVSVEPRRGAPNGVPSGSALTAPLKTFRFQRGPVLREGKAMRRRTCFARGSLSAWSAYKKASPERGGAREAGGGVPFPHAALLQLLIKDRRRVVALLYLMVPKPSRDSFSP